MCCLLAVPGEFFAGRFFHNLDDNAVYAQMGKVSPVLFRLKGWANNTVQPLVMHHNSTFSMTPELISPPDMAALEIRHRGAQTDVKTAVFRRVSTTPAIDGSAKGWSSADTNVTLWADGSHSVTAQLLHDDDTVYVREHNHSASRSL